jgi:hypothetical protein
MSLLEAELARNRNRPLDDLVRAIPRALAEPLGSDDVCLLGARLNPEPISLRNLPASG